MKNLILFFTFITAALSCAQDPADSILPNDFSHDSIATVDTSDEVPALKETKLFISLPDYCPTPDNMDVAPDGTLILTCPNYASSQVPGVVVRIDTAMQVTQLANLPGRLPGWKGIPKGLDHADDGSLFVCNAHGQGQGQVIRLTFKDGQVDSTQIVASGIDPNGLKYHNGYVYVTQTGLPAFKTDSSVTGGLYRFKETDRDIVVTGKADDPNLILTKETTNQNRLVGLDGLTFDNDGKLYVGEFGDATIYKLTLDDNGNIVNEELYVQLPDSTGLDGMVMDDDNNLFVVGFSQNQLLKVTPDKRIVVVAEYPDNDGSNGELDQPVDVAFYNDKLLIANFDLMSLPGMVNQSHGKPYTISYIDISDLY